jgi:hypothetical protein
MLFIRLVGVILFIAFCAFLIQDTITFFLAEDVPWELGDPMIAFLRCVSLFFGFVGSLVGAQLLTNLVRR